jgi:hypothetical protein
MGRYAPRDRSQQHRTQPPHRSQQQQHRPQPPHCSQQQPGESPRSTYVRFEDTETNGDRGSRAGDGGGRSGASGGRGGRSARPFNYAARASPRRHSSGLYSQQQACSDWYASDETHYYPMYVPLPQPHPHYFALPALPAAYYSPPQPQPHYFAPQEPLADHYLPLSTEQLNFISPYISPTLAQPYDSPAPQQLDDSLPAEPRDDDSLPPPAADSQLTPTPVMMVSVLPQPPDMEPPDMDWSPPPTFRRQGDALHFRRQEAILAQAYDPKAAVALRFHSINSPVNQEHPYTLIVDSGSPKNLFPLHMLSNLSRHNEWICGVGERTLYSPFKGTARLHVCDPSHSGRSIIMEVDAWGLYDRDVGPRFSPLLSLASIVHAGVTFTHTKADGPLLVFPDGTTLLLRDDYTLHACIDNTVPVPAPGNA